MTNVLRRILVAVESGELSSETGIQLHNLDGCVYVNLCTPSTYNVVNDVKRSSANQFIVEQMFPGGGVRVEQVYSQQGPRTYHHKRRTYQVERCRYALPDHKLVVTFLRMHEEHEGTYKADTREQGNRKWVPWRHTCCGVILLQKEVKAASLR